MCLAELPSFDIPSGRQGREKGIENYDTGKSGLFRDFDDIFAKYTKKSELVRVRTVNMGSLYELCYQVDLKSEFIEKNMLDEIRCRNGTLPLSAAGCRMAGMNYRRIIIWAEMDWKYRKLKIFE